MLVYVRTADMDKYLKEVEEEEIPEDLRARFEEEERQEAERRLAEKEKYLSTEFRVFTEKDLVENPELTFGLFDTLTKDESRIVRVKKTEPAKVLVEKVAEMTGISPEEMQIWKFSFVALPRPDRLIDLSNQERNILLLLLLHLLTACIPLLCCIHWHVWSQSFSLDTAFCGVLHVWKR